MEPAATYWSWVGVASWREWLELGLVALIFFVVIYVADGSSRAVGPALVGTAVFTVGFSLTASKMRARGRWPRRI